MTDEAPILPEAIDLERTKFEEHARDRAERAVRASLLLLVVDVGLVVATFLVAYFQSIAMEPWLIVLILGSIPASVMISSVMWLPALLQRKHYNSKTQSVWTLRCHDTMHEWCIEGIGPATGWRDLNIECKKLPRQFIASPKLHVRIDNEHGVLKSGHLQDGGDHTSLFVIDKTGLPIGITIGHVEPKHASEDEPWVVELTLFGDANALETLLAWPVPKQVQPGGVEGDAIDINRQG